MTNVMDAIQALKSGTRASEVLQHNVQKSSPENLQNAAPIGPMNTYAL